MGSLKSRILVALAVVCAASFVTFMEVKANDVTDDQISSDAIWAPEKDDLNEILQNCKSSEAPQYDHCFIEQMGNYASSEAVAFSQMLAKAKSPDVGYLDGIREAGEVDLGYVNYPAGQGLTRGWVLLNGTPALINVDNLALLPQAQLEKDTQFKALRTIDPTVHLVVDSADRKSDIFPQIEALASGGERFIIPYSLRGSCSSCAPLAHAAFSFDFDATGEFIGASFIKTSVEK